VTILLPAKSRFHTSGYRMVNEMWITENIFDILVSDNLVYNEYTYEEESRTRRDNAERISKLG
jgi:hypothetical protein